MFQFTRTQTFVLVRTSRIAQMVVAGLVIFLIATGALFYNMKTINVTINGEPVCITTVFGTVGQALSHSKIKFYPEDIVIPSRETKVTKGLAVEVTKSLPVQFSVDDQTFSTRTAAKTVGEAITELAGRYGIAVKEVDEVNVSRFEEVTSQMEIKVRKAIPIIVNADGKKSETYIAPRSVAEALKKLGITLGDKDKISLALEHMLEPNDQLNVVRVTEKIETVKSEIPYQTVAQAADFPVGLPDKIVSRGSNGAQEQTVRLTLEDGKEVDREILGQRVVKAPINQLVSRGTQTSISRGGSTIYFKRAYVMKASAYCSPGGTTATGAAVSSGIVAVDPGLSLWVKKYMLKGMALHML